MVHFSFFRRASQTPWAQALCQLCLFLNEIILPPSHPPRLPRRTVVDVNHEGPRHIWGTVCALSSAHPCSLFKKKHLTYFGIVLVFNKTFYLEDYFFDLHDFFWGLLRTAVTWRWASLPLLSHDVCKWTEASFHWWLCSDTSITSSAALREHPALPPSPELLFCKAFKLIGSPYVLCCVWLHCLAIVSHLSYPMPFKTSLKNQRTPLKNVPLLPQAGLGVPPEILSWVFFLSPGHLCSTVLYSVITEWSLWGQ